MAAYWSKYMAVQFRLRFLHCLIKGLCEESFRSLTQRSYHGHAESEH